MWTLLVFFVTTLFVVILGQRDDFKLRDDFKRSVTYNPLEKFCPNASPRNSFRCLARPTWYKCGVFFIDLPGMPEPITYVSGLPEILRNPIIARSPEIRASLAGAKPESFNFKDQANEKCNGRTANSRCFAIMSKLRSTSYRECSKNIINESGEDTFGNILCEKLEELYSFSSTGLVPDKLMQDGAVIGFHHSECGSDWTPTGNPQGPLQAPRKLCCQKESTSGRLLQVPCNGLIKKSILTCQA